MKYSFKKAGYFLMICTLILTSCQNKAIENTGLGTIKIKTTTESKEAEELFLKGLAALHSFWYPEAENQFIKAQELDTTYHMAIWGEAMTQNMTFWQRQDKERGQEIIRKLAEMDNSKLSEFERSLIESLNYLYDSAEQDKLNRDENYKNYLANVYQKFPEQQEAKALYALSILGMIRNGHDNSKILME